MGRFLAAAAILGNEFGVSEIAEKDAALGVEAGHYVGLLSHSGSRALSEHLQTIIQKSLSAKAFAAGCKKPATVNAG